MRGIFYDVYFSLSFTDHSQQGVVGENDIESGCVKNVSGKCYIIVQSAITFVVILGWHTQLAVVGENDAESGGAKKREGFKRQKAGINKLFSCL